MFVPPVLICVWCGSVRKLQFWRVNCADVISKVHIVNNDLIVDVTKGVAELDGFCNVMFHFFDHEIVLEGMKEEISEQRCTIGAHCLFFVTRTVCSLSNV